MTFPPFNQRIWFTFLAFFKKRKKNKTTRKVYNVVRLMTNQDAYTPDLGLYEWLCSPSKSVFRMASHTPL